MMATARARIGKALGLALMVGATTPAFGADRGDIFIEVQAGPRFEHTVEAMTGLSTGYCFWNSFSLGVGFDQFLALKERVAETAGFGVGLDLHWFLEPFEISGQIGYFVRSEATAPDRLSLSGSLIYLFALTPAMAVKAEVRARYLWDESTKLFWALGGRVLF